MKLLIVLNVFVFIIYVNSAAEDNNDNFRIIDSIYQEKSCNSQGGMCVIADDCPKDQLSEQRGLCPEQRSRGVECCYGMSIKETRCSNKGGICTKDCIQRLIVSTATDCLPNESCCILV